MISGLLRPRVLYKMTEFLIDNQDNPVTPHLIYSNVCSLPILMCMMKSRSFLWHTNLPKVCMHGTTCVYDYMYKK